MSKDRDPGLLVYTKDFLEGTHDLSESEMGVYCRLIFHQHQRDFLPVELEKLARLGGASTENFQKIWPSIQPKFTLCDQGYFNERCASEIAKRSLSARRKSVLAVFANWVKACGLSKKTIDQIKSEFDCDDFIAVEGSENRAYEITTFLQTTAERIAKRSPIANGDGNEDAIKDSPYGKLGNLFFGDVPEDIHSLSKRLRSSNDASEWQDYVQGELEALGYSVKREVVVFLQDGSRGRIDLVASDGNREIAIELDYRTPKSKSVLKVRTYSAGCVLLRDPRVIKKASEPFVIPPAMEMIWDRWKQFKKDQFKFTSNSRRYLRAH